MNPLDWLKEKLSGKSAQLLAREEMLKRVVSDTSKVDTTRKSTPNNTSLTPVSPSENAGITTQRKYSVATEGKVDRDRSTWARPNNPEMQAKIDRLHRVIDAE